MSEQAKRPVELRDLTNSLRVFVLKDDLAHDEIGHILLDFKNYEKCKATYARLSGGTK